MPAPLRVLITNLFVAHNSGSETVVELLADGLRRAGHLPMVLAPTLGPQADRMRARGHVLVDRVAKLPARPDVIHAQHTPVALAAMAAFPDVPAIFTCHSALFEVEGPRPHPQIRHWVAVDDLCRERCLSRGVPADRLVVIANAVDMHRFARRASLPARPSRALLLSKNHGHQTMVRQACAARGLTLDELGPAAGNVSDRIEAVLPDYDLVFATARMALEAATVGCSVVVCDARGFAGLLTLDRLPAWRRLNFGAGLLTEPVGVPGLLAAIDAYDADDASGVADCLRAEASLDACVDRYLALYAAALADLEPVDRAARAAATAAWIEDLTPSTATGDWHRAAAELFAFTADPPAAALQAMEFRLGGLVEASNQRLDRALDTIRTEIVTAGSRLAAAEDELRSQTIAVGAKLDGRVADTHAATEALIAHLAAATEGLRLAVERPTLARLFWRRLMPVPFRQVLHRMLAGR